MKWWIQIPLPAPFISQFRLEVFQQETKRGKQNDRLEGTHNFSTVEKQNSYLLEVWLRCRDWPWRHSDSYPRPKRPRLRSRLPVVAARTRKIKKKGKTKQKINIVFLLELGTKWRNGQSTYKNITQQKLNFKNINFLPFPTREQLGSLYFCPLCVQNCQTFSNKK